MHVARAELAYDLRALLAGGLAGIERIELDAPRVALDLRRRQHGPAREPAKRLSCLLTTLHRERALSNALVQHLSHEMPDIAFTLKESGQPEVIWVCGFEPGAEPLVADLRRRHPEAFVVITGRGPVGGWERGAREAGADYCCGWPLPVQELSRVLHAPLGRVRI